jgi:DNA-binding NtrC family response regulator
VARAIQANGPRAGKPFLAVNAAELPEPVLESELFGHERGAFTGAIARHVGLFEAASGGTLFLDEVGELSLPTQAKLLRILETGELRRLGGSETLHVDVRLITATNRDLRRDVGESTFRADLFFRLAVVELRVPPLRDRPQDLEPLIAHLLRRMATHKDQATIRLSEDALAVLRRHPFPGNVRELKNCLEHALNFCSGTTISAADLPAHVGRPAPTPEAEGFPTLAEVERDHVEQALRRAHWNKKLAASLLGIDRKTLYAKIDLYGLRPDTPVPGAPTDSAEPSPTTEIDRA